MEKIKVDEFLKNAKTAKKNVALEVVNGYLVFFDFADKDEKYTMNNDVILLYKPLYEPYNDELMIPYNNVVKLIDEL